MKNVLFIFLIAAKSIYASNVDTIDFWHVYYNKIKIREYDENSRQKTITLKRDSIKPTDSITVKYFRDTPCSDCTTRVTIKDDQGNNVSASEGKGTFKPVSFLLKDLISYKKEKGLNAFEVFYSEKDKDQTTEKVFLFSIKLE